jgi:hypothetical protein
MRKHLLAAGIAAATLIPSFALAQTTCEQQHNQRIVGTVGGGLLGALLGSAVAGHGDKTTGAVIGGVGGAVIGNQISKPHADCAHAYGYYDTNGAWHATAVERASAQGYYDRNGQWVAGTPNGYYDSQNRWIAANTSASASGYYDNQNRWVPASASGYYDTDGNWVGGVASGYYDGQGRWIAGPTSGRYDSSGRWMSGQPSGHRDQQGVWVADAEPGYYDTNGRWRAGQAVGYYDTQGRWIATARSAADQGYNSAYQNSSNWAGAPTDFHARAAWLDQRIRTSLDDGSLSHTDGKRALRSLNDIRREEQHLRRYNGQLTQRDDARLQAKLDNLGANIRLTRQTSYRND